MPTEYLCGINAGWDAALAVGGIGCWSLSLIFRCCLTGAFGCYSVYGSGCLGLGVAQAGPDPGPDLAAAVGLGFGFAAG